MTRQTQTAAALAAAWMILTSPALAQEGFSHDDWTAVLQRFVDGEGLVDYRGLAKDRAVFDLYLARVQTTSPETDPGLFPTRDDELAYYLNAYNALVFDGVLARGPEEDSVWSPFGTGLSFFAYMDITVGGKKTSLKSLEDDVVRKRYQDPRIHAALNCASIGCPRLPPEAFLGSRLDEQLDREMRLFVSEARNCTVDPQAKTVKLSKIFDWFAEDFLAWERRQGGGSPSILDYVNRYRAAGKEIPKSYKVSYFDYDKGINKQ